MIMWIWLNFKFYKFCVCLRVIFKDLFVGILENNFKIWVILIVLLEFFEVK